MFILKCSFVIIICNVYAFSYIFYNIIIFVIENGLTAKTFVGTTKNDNLTGTIDNDQINGAGEMIL